GSLLRVDGVRLLHVRAEDSRSASGKGQEAVSTRVLLDRRRARRFTGHRARALYVSRTDPACAADEARKRIRFRLRGRRRLGLQLLLVHEDAGVQDFVSRIRGAEGASALRRGDPQARTRAAGGPDVSCRRPWRRYFGGFL